MRHAALKGKKVDDTVWYCGREWLIISIGRKWVNVIMVQSSVAMIHAPIQRRFNIKTAIADFHGSSWSGDPTLGQCYATREEMEAAQCQS